MTWTVANIPLMAKKLQSVQAEVARLTLDLSNARSALRRYRAAAKKILPAEYAPRDALVAFEKEIYDIEEKL